MWLWLLGVVLIVSCGPIIIPGPKPEKKCPGSCPVGSECKDPNLGCQPIPAPGPVCQEGQHHSCYHWPTGSSTWVYACPVYDSDGGVIDVLNVLDPATCPAKPEPKPIPASCADLTCPEPDDDPRKTECRETPNGPLCVMPTPPPPGETNCDGEPGPLLQPKQFLNSYGDAVNKVMAARTGCAIGSDCKLGNKTLQVWNREVVADLRERGICAGQHKPSHTDEIAVAKDRTSVRQSYHIGAGDDGSGDAPPGGNRRVVWAPGAVRAAYSAPAGPPPEDGCTAPVPPKCDRYNLKAHQKTNDATCLVYNGTDAKRWDGSTVTGYCDSVGFVNRLHCPPRLECEVPPNPKAVKCGERVACEAIATSGKPDGKPIWKSDGMVNLTDNPFLATCTNCTWLEICNADGTGCGRCVIDKNTGQCS
jgi:hypothetical protein